METRKTKIWSNNLLQEGLEDTPSNQINQTWPRLQSNMMWGQSLKVHLCLPIFIVKKDTKRSIVLLLRLVSLFTERTLLFFIWYFHKKNGDEPLNHKHSKYEKTYCLPWTEFERFRALFPLVLASSPEFCLSLLIPLSFPDPSSLESISMGTAST